VKQKTSRGHGHAEAFCLMRYECRDCDHQEIIWNSRDGVTPFMMQCPACWGTEMVHVDWSDDEYAPDHVPTAGQGVWIGFPPELRRPMAAARIRAFDGSQWEVPQEHRAALIQSLMESQEFGPEAPFLIRWPGYSKVPTDDGG